jgi:hypothetical protein
MVNEPARDLVAAAAIRAASLRATESDQSRPRSGIPDDSSRWENALADAAVEIVDRWQVAQALRSAFGRSLARNDCQISAKR